MTESAVLDASRGFMMMALKLSMPILLLSLVAGVLVSIFQAVTQIQEYTLTFVPKLLTIIAALIIFGPWMISTLVGYMTHSFSVMPPVNLK